MNHLQKLRVKIVLDRDYLSFQKILAQGYNRYTVRVKKMDELCMKLLSRKAFKTSDRMKPWLLINFSLSHRTKSER